MISIAGFISRNPGFAFKEIRQLWTVRKAMDAFRESNPSCEACGTKKSIHIHHIVPVHINPMLAGSESNFIALCKKHHLAVGHGRSWKSYVPNVCEISLKIKSNIRH